MELVTRVAMALMLGTVATLAIGCSSAGKRPQNKGAAKDGRAADQRLFDPIDNPSGFSSSEMMSAAVLPLGQVPYDNLVLPLVSPDGQFMATQTGAAPTWETILAEPSAQAPSATSIEIYKLDRREGIEQKDRQPAALGATLSEPLLLGRSCDRDGFLVEAPREDGSRWIGKGSWHTGEVTWLVSGAEVNAFAALGPEGRLAWSRRAVDGEHFDLVIRQDNEEFIIPGQDSDWLFPVWSGRAAWIFTLRLNQGALEAVHARASDAGSFNQSTQRLMIASGADIHTAYQAVYGQTEFNDGRAPAREQLVFFHPASRRMAVWRPLGGPKGRQINLSAGSIAALVDDRDFALVCTEDWLVSQNLEAAQGQVKLVAGAQVPRRTTLSAWPYMLLAPGEGRVSVVAMRLLVRDRTVAREPESVPRR